MSTALTIFGYQGAAIAVPTAAPVTASGGSPTLSGVTTLIGTATGWSEVFGQGSTPPGSGFNTPWAAAPAIGDPSGRGWLLDSAVLDGQDMLGGSWTNPWQLSVSSGSIVADVAGRISIWVPGSDSTIPVGMILLPAQTLTTTITTYTLTGLIDQFRMLAGYKLYLELWLNVTTNTVGSGTLTVAVQLPTTAVGSSSSAEWVTPGFQPSTQAEVVQGVSYGGFLLSDTRGYYVQERDFSFPTWTQTTQKIGRRIGVKKSGETINQKDIAIKVKVVGKSRGDLLQKIDALYQALMLRQQRLVINSFSGRYFIADCVDGKVNLGVGNVISAEAALKFAAQMPFALDPNQGSYIDGPVAYVLLQGTTFQRSGVVFQADGNVWTDPTIVVTNNTATTTSTLGTALTSGNPVSTIVTTSGIGKALLAGDLVTLVNGGNTQVFVSSGTVASGATSIPVVTQNANFSYPITTTSVILDTVIQSITINDVTDGRSVTVSPASMSNGKTLTIVCDADAANGQQVYQSIGAPLTFTGDFPTLEPFPTSWSIQAQAAIAPTLTIQWTWTPRWAV